MRARLLIDEIFSREATERLRELGHDVTSALCPSWPDVRVWALAVGEGRGIVTENVVDFRPLLATALREGDDAVAVVAVLRRRLPRGGALAGALALRLHDFLAPRDDLPVTEWWP